MDIIKKGATSTERKAYRYKSRCRAREETLILSTIQMQEYFEGLGDTIPDAKTKVRGINEEVKEFLYLYVLGNVQPLKDAVNNINIGTLSYMDAAAKAFLIDKLTPTV
jgi:hypothetical protein